MELNGRGHGGELRGSGAVSGGSVAARAAGGLAPVLRVKKRQLQSERDDVRDDAN